MNVTRGVIVDLWPLYESGEASADSRALVDEFLKQHPDVEQELRHASASSVLAPPPVALRSDHELEAFKRTRRAVHRIDWTFFLAMLFSCFAFGRIVSDTSWDVSPRNFEVVAGIAVVFWIAFITRLVRKLSSLR